VSIHYHDDPVKKPAARRTPPKFVAVGLLLLYVFFIYETTFALNFRLNSNTTLEFAQSTTTTAPCTGDSELTVTPRSLFVNADNGDGTYYLSSVQIAGIPAACRGKNFDISFYDSATGSSALPIYSVDGANQRVATVYSTKNANIFAPGFQRSGIAVSSANQAFTVTFKTPIALSSNVKKVTLQSIAGQEGAEAISSYASTTCLLLTSSETRCWGEGSLGQLGRSSTVDASTPVSAFNLGAGVVDIASGSLHTCAVFQTGIFQCWGQNNLGQFGNGSLDNVGSPTPVAIANYRGATAVAIGENHTCAIMDTGRVKCSGWNNAGQIGSCSLSGGSGAGTHCKTPQEIPGLSSVTAIAAGKYHTCAILATGGVKCWGFNPSGQLGSGNNTNSSTPLDVVDLNAPATRIAAGGETTCAVLSNGGARCWGSGHFGSLGNSRTASSNPSWNTSQNRPQVVSNITTAVDISIKTHGCAVLRNGQVQCWGYSNVNQTGYVGNNGTPQTVAGVSGAVKIVTGSSYSCAVLRTGGVQCWGANDVGQLGNGTTNGIGNSPVSVTGIP